MTNINPFGPRIAVVEPPTEHRASGLIVVSEEEAVATGIVIRNRMVEEQDRLSADPEFDEAMRMAHQLGHTTIALIEEEELMLKAGVVVFYQKHSGVKIKDVIIVPLNAIIAWEA